jgi:glycosyltransferase involved in cell wall biosynthesis
MKLLVFIEQSLHSRYWEAALPKLKDRGVDVQFATIKEKGDIHEMLAVKGINSLALGGRGSKDYPALILRLAKFMRQNHFDVIHAAEAIPAALAGIACLLTKETKCIFHYHHTYVTGAQKKFSQLGSRLSDVVMTVSESSRRATVELEGTRLEKTFVAYNGIEPFREVADVEKQNVLAALAIPRNAKIVLIVARLRTVKGHRTLFEACGNVAGVISDELNLIVVGDGEEMHALLRESERFPSFRTHFVGHQEDVALWYSLADAVAMPSYFEPFGLVAVEAMICGKPLVASNVEGPAEIVENGISGILVPPKDAAALADALVKVFDSPEWAREIGENARKRVLETFTMETMVESWIDCYKSVLDRPGNNN